MDEKIHDRIIMVPVTMDIPKRKADGSVKLGFTTLHEIATDEYVTMDSYRQSQGWMLYRENEFTEEDVPQEDVDVEGTKSPSKRLRSTLYVYHMQKDGDPAKFRLFYESTLEKYINSVKEKLDGPN